MSKDTVVRKQVVPNGERPLTVDQRKMLYRLTDEIFSRRAAAQREKDGILEEQYKESIRKDLGIDAIDIEIQKLESQIEALKAKKLKLGIDHNYGSFSSNGKAKLLLESRLSQTPGRTNIRDEQDEVLSKLLLVRTVAEAEVLIEKARVGTR